ncbi:zinc finger B-box domain-containing protein 1 [Octodon degus]|uniref:Zinc finger B-box domain-containing protein 1 n=1 Tax=Octodon degus TaxID=10160 RepID=A0A6P6EMM3_OCTDE|nr:zinc finger B-box domain-containing protein 1 [Octodon degus]
MNTKDFVVLPWGKSGNSVRLKYKNVQELRMEKIQLELENQEMEKKLQEFQGAKDGEKKEIKSSGYHWKSGKVTKLGHQSHLISQNKATAIKVSPGKVKLKSLKQQFQEPVKQPINHKMANCSRNEKPKIKGKVCGQCENKAALLVCLECGEDYCSGCFAKIHQKGALKLHRTTLLQARSEVFSRILDVAHGFIKEINPAEAKGENTAVKGTSEGQPLPGPPALEGRYSEVEITTTRRADCTEPGERLLCEGSFDEEASAQSFQEVLRQWRAGSHKDQKQPDLLSAKPDSLEECEVQTNLKIWREPISIEFKEDSSLSYMEKLWLKKHRRTPQEQHLSLLPDTSVHPREASSGTQGLQNGNDGDSDVEEAKVQYPTLFLPVEELKVERPEPSLQITELDEPYEEEFEEPGNLVPYKVELANADSQLSCNIIMRQEVGTGISHAYFDNIVDSDSYYPDIEKIEESSTFEENLKEKSINIGNKEKSEDSNISPDSKDLPTVPESFVEEKFSQETKESFKFSNVYEKPNFEDSKAKESQLLLQEIAIRNKPKSQPYQGLERFFTFDSDVRCNLLLPDGSPYSSSYSRIPLSGDREWIPRSSLSAHAEHTAVLGSVMSVLCSLPTGRQQQTGQKSQRPSTANLPLSNSIKVCSSSLLSSRPQSRSTEALSLPRSASEISEIEYIDRIAPNAPFLDNIADQQSLGNSAKELNILRNLTDPSEKVYDPNSEELPALSNNSLSRSQISSDFTSSSYGKGPYGVEELSSSGADTKIPSLLSFSESRKDEEKEDFLDKQLVITPSWSKSI